MVNSQHAVAVLIVSPEGVPLVKDPKKPLPHYWKLPGGRSEGNETPAQCAVREVREELGLRVPEESLQILQRQNRETHMLTFFRAALPSLEGLRKEGAEREEIGVFSLEEIRALPDFFPNHKRIV